MSRSAKIVLVVALVAALVPALGRAQAVEPQYLEAKRLFDGLDYDNAIRALDQVIGGLQGRPVQDAGRRAFLPSALEMRARAKFGLGDQDGAKADFVALLRVNPAYTIAGQVSPRVIGLFDDAAKEATTTFSLAVTPATAKIELDGFPVTPSDAMPIAVGEHVLTVDRPGYRRVQQTVLAEVGKRGEASIVLERIGSLLTIFTVPAEVDVIIDGVKRGRMTAGAPPAEYADAIAKSGVSPAQAAAVMVLSDLTPGSHLIEFSRECYVRGERRVTIERPDDYSVGPVTLERAVASLTVRSSEANAQFFVDGQGRGGSPFATELCEGDHTVELRTPAGRYFKRVQAHTGERIALDATIKPAVALVAVTGQTTTGGPDLRLVVERTFDALRGTTLFAPPADQLDQALKTSQLPAGWLAFDANRRPMEAAADLGPAQRREASAKLSAAFGAQGVASVTVVGRNRIALSLLAVGSGLPDVVAVSLDVPDSITAAMAQLDASPSLFRPSLGLVAIDVADVTGAVVASVEAGGPASAAGIRPGNVITKANGPAINDTRALAAVLAGLKANDELMLELQDRGGPAKSVNVKVLMTPQLVGVADQTLPANQTLLALRARLAAENSPAEEAVVRLNLAATLVHLEAWGDARTELLRVKLPDGPGVANGTVQYLLGLCAERLGDRAAAETALRAAAASESLLTENGPPVKELAAAKLADLNRPAR